MSDKNNDDFGNNLIDYLKDLESFKLSRVSSYSKKSVSSSSSSTVDLFGKKVLESDAFVLNGLYDFIKHLPNRNPHFFSSKKFPSFSDFSQKFEVSKNNYVSILRLKSLYDGLANTTFDLFNYFSEFNNLGLLDLSINALSFLPPDLLNLDKLLVLDLSYNSFSSLSNLVGDMVNLDTLFLHYNSLYSLPSNFGNLVNLKNLILSHNSFDVIPEVIGDLPNLEKLHLSGNKFTYLPDSFKNLKKLKSLSLSSTDLRSVPKYIFDLPNLKELYLNLCSIPFKQHFNKRIKIRRETYPYRDPFTNKILPHKYENSFGNKNNSPFGGSGFKP